MNTKEALVLKLPKTIFTNERVFNQTTNFTKLNKNNLIIFSTHILKQSWENCSFSLNVINIHTWGTSKISSISATSSILHFHVCGKNGSIKNEIYWKQNIFSVMPNNGNMRTVGKACNVSFTCCTWFLQRKMKMGR